MSFRQDTRRPATDHATRTARNQPQVLDPILCSLLPKSLVENHIMPYITHVFTSNEGLKNAVDNYIENPSSFNYPIGLWDVSQMRDFSSTFDARRNRRLENFNEDLSRWNMSNATDLTYVFYGCISFNGNVSTWNLSNATNLDSMFCRCRSFNGDVSSWDVSGATDLNFMFCGCRSFNGDVSAWDVSNARDLSGMFYECESFSGDVSAWDVSNATDFELMFGGCSSFNRNIISAWNMSDDAGFLIFFR